MAKKKKTQSLDLPHFDFDLGQRRRISFIIRLKLTAPLSHIMPVVNAGNRSAFNKIGVVGLDGRPTEVPILSSASFRTLCLREAGIGKTLEALQIQVPKDVHNTLFSGGFASAGDSNENNMELYEQLERYFAPLAVVGCCKPAGVFGSGKTQYVHGQIDIGHFYLKCFESATLLPTRFLGEEEVEAIAELRRDKAALDRLRSPDGFRDVLIDGSNDEKAQHRIARREYQEKLTQYSALIRRKLPPYGRWLADYHFTRRDAGENPKIKHLVAEPAAPLLEAEASAPSPKKTKDTSKMIASSEVAVAGAEFVSQWHSVPMGITEVGLGFIAFAFSEFSSHPAVGGQAARGAGGYPEIDVWHAIDGEPQGLYLSASNNTQHFSPQAEQDLQRYLNYLDRYRDWLAEAAEPARAFLGAG
jgi:hypothetical protein